MTPDFLDKNEEILRARFPGFLERLEEDAESPCALSVSTGPSGEPALSANGRWVHSRVDPRREASRLAAQAAGDGPLAVLGFGLGYAAEAAASLDPERFIVVVERHPKALLLAFRTRDLTGLLSRSKIAFVAGGPPESAAAALDGQQGKLSVLSNRTLRETDPGWYDRAEESMRSWAAKDEVNAATLKKFGHRWVRNLVRNLTAVRDLPGVSALAGCASGLPAILVAAGPTLDAVLPLLPRIARRCVVVAVDTALRATLAAGVDPDFVVVVDPQYWNARHLDRCPAPRSTLIAESAVYPSVLNGRFPRTFLCSSLYPLGKFVEDKVDPKGALGAGGSVATTAWDFVRILGAAPIWVAGLDLSFPDLQTHFKGALFEERIHAESFRFVPGDFRSFRALRDGAPFWGKRTDGEPVLTDRRLALYASWFENRFLRHPEAAPIGLSGRSLRIAGMETGSPEDLLKLPERREEIDRRLAAAFDAADAHFGASREERSTAFRRRVSELENSLRSLSEIAREAARAADAALATQAPESVLPTLDQANARIASSEGKEIAGFLFPSVSEIEQALCPERRDALTRHVEFSLLLYRKLEESATFNLALLEKRKKT